MRSRLVDFQTETGQLFNLEATPAEGTSYRLAQLDKKAYPAIITAGDGKAPYYTNSTQLPVGYTDDLFEAWTCRSLSRLSIPVGRFSCLLGASG